ncbi:unnamed protein product [Plutella xylostella]|uniref:(diamondback moth) hypothetical protein n=1 Tax=Plutella xylostella TaxID=51655 RepID=A0A8S4G448_PLUXY|nr:unnamed protein product [Plutella xylostella]
MQKQVQLPISIRSKQCAPLAPLCGSQSASGSAAAAAAERRPWTSRCRRPPSALPEEHSAKRGTTPVPGGDHEPGEYNFRESFEHSSSESALTTHTTEPRPPDDWSRPSSVEHTPHALTTLHNMPPAPRRFNLLRTFVPSFLFVCLSLVLTTILLFETDVAPSLKKKQEMVTLQYHYYAPLKEYLKRKVVELF